LRSCATDGPSPHSGAPVIDTYLPPCDINAGRAEGAIGVDLDDYDGAFEAVLARFGGYYPSGFFGSWIEVRILDEAFAAASRQTVLPDPDTAA
jgi:hypothetical protein